MTYSAINQTDALHALGASIATMTSFNVCSTATVAVRTANAPVLQALEVKTALNRCAVRYQMARTDLLEKATSATVKMAGKVSTAMSAPRTEPAMP
jgi:hypothetical protein